MSDEKTLSIAELKEIAGSGASIDGTSSSARDLLRNILRWQNMPDGPEKLNYAKTQQNVALGLFGKRIRELPANTQTTVNSPQSAAKNSSNAGKIKRIEDTILESSPLAKFDFETADLRAIKDEDFQSGRKGGLAERLLSMLEDFRKIMKPGHQQDEAVDRIKMKAAKELSNRRLELSEKRSLDAAADLKLDLLKLRENAENENSEIDNAEANIRKIICFFKEEELKQFQINHSELIKEILYSEYVSESTRKAAAILFTAGWKESADALRELALIAIILNRVDFFQDVCRCSTRNARQLFLALPEAELVQRAFPLSKLNPNDFDNPKPATQNAKDPEAEVAKIDSSFDRIKEAAKYTIELGLSTEQADKWSSTWSKTNQDQLSKLNLLLALEAHSVALYKFDKNKPRFLDSLVAASLDGEYRLVAERLLRRSAQTGKIEADEIDKLILCKLNGGQLSELLSNLIPVLARSGVMSRLKHPQDGETQAIRSSIEFVLEKLIRTSELNASETEISKLVQKVLSTGVLPVDVIQRIKASH
ncbi:MAG: hypothetical protein IAF58_21610 [Leptolyngbya sp.]|nr:hypothetical protein [Candidatus Melainabacteria bacterium]